MMQQRYRYILPLLCSLLLAACGSDDSTSPANTATGTSGTQPIMFSAGMGAGKQAPTRAANDINTNPDLSTQGGFGVFGCYTGLHRYSDSNVRPDFMYNEHVTYNSSNNVWEYTPVKYWPNGEGETSSGSVTGENPHYVSFMAYAPYSDNNGISPDTNPAGYCIPSFSLQGEIGNPWLTYRLIEQAHLSHQVDLLYAKHSNVYPILDLTKPENPNTKVMFQFEHALACVGDKVSINCSDKMQTKLNEQVSEGTNIRMDVTKLEIVYTLTSKARLVLWNGGEPNWQPIYSEQPTCTRTVTLVNDGDPVVAYSVKDLGITPETEKHEWDGSGVFYIPTELSGFPQTAQVNLTYCISTYSGGAWVPGIPKEGSVTINLKNYADAYMPGKHLYINVTINDDTTSFIVTAAIEDWTPGNVADGEDVEAI